MSFWKTLDGYANKALDAYTDIEVAKASNDGSPSASVRPETVNDAVATANLSAGPQVADPGSDMLKIAMYGAIGVAALVAVKVVMK